MSNRLRNFVNEIKQIKGWTIQEVADSIGYSREHLTKQMKIGNDDMLFLLINKHPDIRLDDKGMGDVKYITLNKETKDALSDLYERIIRAEGINGVLLETCASLLSEKTGRPVAVEASALRQAASLNAELILRELK